MKIKENIQRIKKEIGNTELVAVTKARSVEEIKEAIEGNVKIIGENKVQEADKKYAYLKEYMKRHNVEFHFIGHLQSNKVKKAVEIFDIIQSVDTLKLAEDIDKSAKESKKMQRIFIQVNIGKENQKSGAMPEQIIDLSKKIKELNNVALEGLMCIPPFSDDPEHSRPYFKEMKKIFDKLDLKFLSMGMTNDYKIAVEEGSNMVRIGTGIFGERR